MYYYSPIAFSILFRLAICHNCKIVSLIAFLFTRFKEEKREKKYSFQERERFFTESVLSFSLFARSMRERKGKDIDM